MRDSNVLCVTLARSPTIVRGHLSAFHLNIVQADLPEDELEESNVLYTQYKDSSHPESGGLPDWAAFIRAQQLACHSALTKVMAIEAAAFEHNSRADVVAANMRLDAQQQAESKSFKTYIEEGTNCESTKIDAIVDIIDRQRDIGRNDGMLILHESVYFNNILEVALKKQRHPPTIFKFDGRMDAGARYWMLGEAVSLADNVLLC